MLALRAACASAQDAKLPLGPNADLGGRLLLPSDDEWNRDVDGGKSWRVSGGAIFDLRHSRPRPAGWTSADAAGLPNVPGLARYDEK